MSEKVNLPVFENFLNQELSSDKELFDTLFSIFENYINEFSQLSVSDSPEDRQSLSKMAHKLRSSSLSFGAEVLAEELVHIEQLAPDIKIEELQGLFASCVVTGKETVEKISDLAHKYLQENAKVA